MTGKYDDIRYLPHPTSRKHPRMSMENRAAQFVPFSALTGYGDALRETARLTDIKIELDEYEGEDLDEKFQMLQKRLPSECQVMITYFEVDEKKAGGRYQELTGKVKKIDLAKKIFQMEDGTEIQVEDILDIQIV